MSIYKRYFPKLRFFKNAKILLWKCNNKFLKGEKAINPHNTHAEATKKKLYKILKEAEDLPTLPTITTSALKLMENPKTSMKDLGQAIGTDQATTSKLLRIVNSAYYGFPRRITTISQALVVIGFEGLRSLIMGLSIQPMFKGDVGKILWRHSVTTAVGAKIITQKHGNVHPEESFVVGLIHDIGRLILSQYFPQEFAYYGLHWYDSPRILKTEREVFGLDHAEIGSKLSTKWNLPSKIVESVQYHHLPNMAQQNQAALIVNIADSISQFIDAEQYIATLPPEQQQEVLIESFVKPEYLQKLKITSVSEEMIEDIMDKSQAFVDILSSTQ